MESSYYSEWETVFKSYKCERDPELDPNATSTESSGRLFGPDGRRLNQAGAIDPTRTSVGMPDTWALVQRIVARVTAELPNLRFRSEDVEQAVRISRGLMYQWDMSDGQRTDKRHTLQTALFGWSVKAWHYQNHSRQRMRRVDPLTADPETAKMIQDQYADQLAEMAGAPPQQQMAQLLERNSRGGMLPIRYNYRGYVGPKATWLFVGDCFPEPRSMSIQTSNWFIVHRWRRKSWLEDLARLYQEDNPEIAENVMQLLRDKPKGMLKSASTGDRDRDVLYRRMQSAIDRIDDQTGDPKASEAEWLITECHMPGDEPKIRYTADSQFIGEIPYPYELDGMIAFTEQILIDDLMSGVGDSHARIIRGLQQLHDRQRCAQSDLVYNILRPLMWTTSNELWDNPDMLKRHGGFRLLKVRTPNELGILGEQGAMAAAASGANDESWLLRMIQVATGENNMSMAANVDPQQSRTATGARIMAYNQDILSKSLVNMHNLSVRDDALMMYWLNRSEMADPLNFDAAKYIRATVGGQPVPEQEPVSVTPEDFQVDGQVEPELGSTLADDDDAKIARAQTIWAIVSSAPQLFNMERARDTVLIALGEGKHLTDWAPPPPQPPPPPETKTSMTVSVKFETLPESVQAALLVKSGVLNEASMPTPKENPAASIPNAALQPPEGPDAEPLGASALMAGVGRVPRNGT